MASGGSFTIDRDAERRMLGEFTAEKVKAVMMEAARAGGMGPPSLGPGDRRVPWSERSAKLEKVLRDYAEQHW